MPPNPVRPAHLPALLQPTQGRAGRLTAPQLALVRCWAEGLDLCEAWQRFLPQAPRPDPRTARAAVARWRAQLATLARAHGQDEAAVLLRRDPEAMPERAGTAPTLDDFRAAQPEDFYSESELQALYEAAHGKPDARSAARRKQRLRQRLLAALQSLERLAVARLPQAADPLVQWLDERLAARLAAAGLLQVGDLLQHLHRHGPGWHAQVHRVGLQAARRIEAWLLEAHRAAAEATALPRPAGLPNVAATPDTLALPPWLGSRAAAPAWSLPLPPTLQVAEAGAGQAWPLAPLERLVLPPAARRLPAPATIVATAPATTASTAAGTATAIAAAAAGAAGAAGAANGTANTHTAEPDSPAATPAPAVLDDLGAVRAWLALQPEGSATWRAYRKECERYLLWALWVRGKPLAALTPEDVRAYAAFLRQPDARWCGPRQTARDSPAWRPFEGPLAPRSQQAALAVLRRLSAWLWQTGHLARDPWPAAGPLDTAAQPRQTPAAAAQPQPDPFADTDTDADADADADAAARQAAAEKAGGDGSAANPAEAAAAGPTDPPPASLQAADLDALLHWCARAPDAPDSRRRLAVLHLLLDGLRLGELALAEARDLQCDKTPARLQGLPVRSPGRAVAGEQGAPVLLAAPALPGERAGAGSDCWLQVASAVGRPRRVRLSAASQGALARHWQDRGLAWPHATEPPGTGTPTPSPPLVGGWRRRGGLEVALGPSQLYLLLRQACRGCALALSLSAQSPLDAGGAYPTHQARDNTKDMDPTSTALAQATRLHNATPQALRRAAAAAALQLGAPLREVQHRLGHRSLASTAALMPD